MFVYLSFEYRLGLVDKAHFFVLCIFILCKGTSFKLFSRNNQILAYLLVSAWMPVKCYEVVVAKDSRESAEEDTVCDGVYLMGLIPATQSNT